MIQKKANVQKTLAFSVILTFIANKAKQSLKIREIILSILRTS
ncbi:hypothetical protein SAMN04490355_100747 [Pelosinus propionicus DSM 13327]|uniref:Uncharacterized protein n=1 Tax=Pelosinus propionicus DSM 13327 TaxID=1123291 RepID=A0A1I4IAD3_9FIRM|nr:hypothetical protein SAMN04490355_100747 [Pelosinus propionicus DSM 13327]